jgi:hypothetical protein
MRKLLILAILFTSLFPVASTAGGGIPQINIFPAPHLSALADTEVLVAVSGAGTVPGEIIATLATKDGKVRVDASLTPVTPGPARFLVRVRIPAAALAPFALGEEVTLTARLQTPGGPALEDSLSAPLLALPAPTASAGWNLVLVSKPAQVYTTRPTSMTYLLYNPKNNPKKANLKLSFKGAEGKVKSKWKTGVEFPAGFSEVTIFVPSSVTSQARLGGATLLETAMLRDGSSKAKDQAILDFDLNTTAAADPASGSAPLRVSFTASTTGGQIPYVYNWSFGDGSTASEQNPFHNYTQPGSFTAVLTVTDALGAKISDEVSVMVSP